MFVFFRKCRPGNGSLSEHYPVLPTSPSRTYVFLGFGLFYVLQICALESQFALIAIIFSTNEKKYKKSWNLNIEFLNLLFCALLY